MDYPGKVITKTQVTPTQTSASGNWTLDDQAAAIKNNNWPVALVPNPISKSLRFNSADSAYLNRTPASAGNANTWTWSGWVKRGALGSVQVLFSAATDTNNFEYFRFESTDELFYTRFVSGSQQDGLTTTAVFRDPSAWYHIVVVRNGATRTIYVNNVSMASGGSNASTGEINQVKAHSIGRRQETASQYFSGYMTETYMIDGQALTPSSFGMTNPQTGQWIPKKYTGTYGTNGFYLNFKDATSTTTLGYDYSGNANNWTTNNFSVTAGAGNDSLTDVPTPWVAYNTTGDVGGVIRGNYCTLNPLDEPATYAAAGSSANGNLDFSVSNDAAMGSTISVSSGKWYWEMTVVSGHSSGSNTVWTAITSITPSSSNKLAWQAGSGSRSYATTGLKYNENTSASYGNTYTNGDVIGCALDLDNGKVYWSKNGTFQASGDPVAGTNAAYTGLTGSWMPEATQNGAVTAWNFGQRPFAYTPPTGFRSLCTTNLPATAIGFGLTNQGNNYFDVSLWAGNGSTQTITNSGSMQPDFVWAKNRTITGSNHRLFDSVRGASKILYSSLTDAEATDANGLTSFNSNGFSIGSTQINDSGSNFVGWQWRASNATAVSNTAGTITSTVSANTTAGFSVVTYTGTGSNATVGHGLGVAPAFGIVKSRSSVTDWKVWHQSLTSAAYYLFLNTTNAEGSASSIWGTSPGRTSTTFSVGTNSDTNASGSTYVAYCFAAVPGYSFFGSFTGNGSGDGPFVYCGFRPRYLMIKRYDASGDPWWVIDSARSPYNQTTLALRPNSSNAEDSGGNANFDFLSNGFKARTSGGGNGNESGATYIIAAFAESPFQFANAR
jgi:hypothetical protein